VAARTASVRPHTGRRRNEAARAAILDAVAAEIAKGRTHDELTIDRIAAAAGVGRQTIYRWWPSKGAVLAEALAESAQRVAPAPDTGSFHGDLRRLLVTSFEIAGREPAAGLLRSVVAEAQRDRLTAAALADFARRRREQLVTVVERARTRGDLDGSVDADFLAEQAFAVLWYRLTVTGAPVGAETADRLTDALLAQLRYRQG
jgi:AcrR family transcriptional regulator